MQSVLSNANFDQATSSLTWRALNALASQQGAPAVDYKRFDKRWQDEGEEGILHQLVDRYDGQGLVLKTDEHEHPEVQGKPKQGQISAMAKRATAKARR